jgi:hypothetical protein
MVFIVLINGTIGGPMTSGTPIPRGLVFVLKSGEVVVEWGEGRVQDILTGDFLDFKESDYAGAVSDSDLEVLKKNGQVVSYDNRIVVVQSLPEPPRETIE